MRRYSPRYPVFDCRREACCYDSGGLRSPFRLLPVLSIFLLALPACGVSFHDGSYGTELFYSLDLQGDRTPNSELTLNVFVTPSYPVPVRIACYYENGDKLTDDEAKRSFEERAKMIGETVLPPPDHKTKPGDDVDRQHLSFKFSIPESGDYFLACMTPAAPENGLGLLFKIKTTEPSNARSPR
jgi:hypothetical protein